MVIVEGAMTAMRSEFAEYLSRYLGYPLLSRPTNIKHPYWDYLPHIKPRVVYDGFHMLDILSGDTAWHYYTSLDRMLLQRATVIIVLTADDDVVRERCKDSGSLQHQLELNDFYRKCAVGNYQNFSPYVHMRFNSTEHEDQPGIDEAKQIEYCIQLLAGIAAFLKSTEEIR